MKINTIFIFISNNVDFLFLRVLIEQLLSLGSNDNVKYKSEQMLIAYLLSNVYVI